MKPPEIPDHWDEQRSIAFREWEDQALEREWQDFDRRAAHWPATPHCWVSNRKKA